MACVFSRNYQDAPPVEPLDKNTEDDQLTLFMEWLLENRNHVAFIVIVSLGVGMMYYVKKVNAVAAEEEAAEDLLAAMTGDFQVAAVDQTKPPSERLQAVASNHSGTHAADNAGFLAASALFDERKYTESAKAFKVFQTTVTGGSPLAAAAAFGLAASLDASGDQVAAKAEYERVTNQHANAPEATQARVALAKIILAESNPDKAKAKELLLAAAQESQAGRIPGFWGREAERLLAPLNMATPKESSNEEKPEPTEK